MVAKEVLEIIINGIDNASRPLSGINGALGGLGRLAKTAGVVIGGVLSVSAAAAGAGLAVLGAGAYAATKEAMEAQEVLAQLNAILKATGGAAGITAEEASDLADSLMQVTRYTDEEILSAETMLLQFKNINESVFPQTTQLALDLATRLGTDATSAAQMLGKALEAPGEGLLRLKQAGIAFTDEQTEMITGMVEAGKVADAQKYILDSLATSIGGAAEAAGNTFAGQMQIFKNTISNVFEDVGGIILPILGDAFKAISPYILEVAHAVASFFKSEEMKSWVQNTQIWIKEKLIPVLNEMWIYFKEKIAPVLGEVKTIINEALIPAFKDAITSIGKLFGKENASTIDVVRGALKLFFDLVVRLAELFGGLVFVVSLLLRLAADVASFFDNLCKKIGGLVNAFRDIDWPSLGKNAILGLMSGLVGMFPALIAQVIAIAQGIVTTIADVLGIHSLSSVMEKMGQNAAGGFLKGLSGGGMTMPAMQLAGVPVMAAAASGGGFSAAPGGGSFNFTYAPYISTASQAEAEMVLRPIIERIIAGRI